MNDRHNFSVPDFLLQFLKIILIINLFRSWNFFDQIYTILGDGADQIGGLLLSVATGNDNPITAQFDKLIGFIFNIATTAMKRGGWSLGPVIIGAIVGIMGVIMGAIAIAIIAVAKIGLGLCIGVAPLIILTLFFKGTSGFFEKWVAWGITFVAVIIITSGLLGLIIVAATAEAGDAGNGVTETFGSAAGILVIGMTSVYFLWQIPSFAAGLAGGATLTGLGQNIAKGLGSLGRGSSAVIASGAGMIAGRATNAASSASSESSTAGLTRTAAVASRVQSIATKASTVGLPQNHPRRNK